MAKRNLFVIAMIVAASIAPLAGRAGAEGNCDFKIGLKQLSQSREKFSENDTAEKIKEELSARKNLLNQIIDCSIGEALNRQSSIRLVETTGYPELLDIKNRMVSKFDEIIGYYKIQKGAVGDLGVEGSKIFSANLKSWRDSNYLPMDDLGKNFLIFIKNQYILQTTQNRFDQINLTLKTLGFNENQSIRDILSQARKNLGLANESNNSAKDIFKRLTWPNEVSDLMVSSLQYLKNAYQNFFDIGKEVQAIMSDRGK